MAVKDIKPLFRFKRKDSTGNFIQFALYDHIAGDFPFLDYGYENFQIGGCGSATLQASRNLGLLSNDMVEIYQNDSTDPIYTGFVLQPPEEGTQTIFTYLLAGYGTKLYWPIIPKLIIQQTKLVWAIKNFLTDSIAVKTDISSSVSEIDIPGQIGTWDTIIDYMVFEWRKPRDILAVLADLTLGEYEYGVGPDRKLYFRPKNPDYPGDEIPHHRWWVGKGVSGFVPEKDFETIRNRLYINVGRMSNGENFYSIHENQPSIDQYGLHEDIVSLPDVFPRYAEKDKFIGITPTSSGFAAATGEANITDEDPETAFESNEDQVGGCRFWSKLGSDVDVTDPERGTGGEVVGNPTYAAGKFGNGIVTSPGNYIIIPTDENGVNMEKGAIELVFKAPFNAENDAAGTRRHLILWDFLNDETGGIQLGYNKDTRRFYVYGKRDVLLDDYLVSQIQQTFLKDDLIHIGFSWDNEGKDLARKITDTQYNILTAALFINGVRDRPFQKTWRSCNINPWLYIGINRNGDQYAGGVVDNLKLYDSPQGNFDHWETEDALDDEQYIEIELNQAAQLGLLRIDSEANDETKYYAAGISVKAFDLEGNEREVFRKENNSEGDLFIRMTPYPATKKIRVSLTKSVDYEWKIYGIHGYEYQERDVAQWALGQLANLKDPVDRAPLVLDDISEIPLPRGKAVITNKEGVQFTYEIKKVFYSAKGNRATLDLGDLQLSPAEYLKRIEREMILNQYRAQKDIANIASGDGLSPGSVTSHHIGNLLADVITTGILKSKNLSATSGTQFNLNTGILTVFEPGGFIIESGGGATIKGGGSLTLEDGGDIILKASLIGKAELIWESSDETWRMYADEDGANETDLFLKTTGTNQGHLILGGDHSGPKAVETTLSGETIYFTWVNGASLEGAAFIGDSFTIFGATNPINLGAIGGEWEDLRLDGTAYIATELQVGGGYGSTGCTIETDGDIRTDGDIFALGATIVGDFGADAIGASTELTVGGGYGSTGCTIESDGDIWTDGFIYVGIDNTEYGRLFLYGSGTGVSTGGRIDLFMAADHDGTYDYWLIRVNDDDLQIGREGAGNLIVIEPTGLLKTTVGKVDAFDGFADNGTSGIDLGPVDPNTLSSITIRGGLMTAAT